MSDENGHDMWVRRMVDAGHLGLVLDLRAPATQAAPPHAQVISEHPLEVAIARILRRTCLTERNTIMPASSTPEQDPSPRAIAANPHRAWSVLYNSAHTNKTMDRRTKWRSVYRRQLPTDAPSPRLLHVDGDGNVKSCLHILTPLRPTRRPELRSTPEDRRQQQSLVSSPLAFQSR